MLQRLCQSAEWASRPPCLRPPPDPETVVVAETASLVLSRGNHLFTAGEPARFAAEVVTGAIALSRSLPDGRRQIVDILGPGRIVGIEAGPAHRVTATAIMRSQVRPMRAPVPDLATRELNIGVARLHAHTLLLGRKTAIEKVASGLLELADLLQAKGPGRRGPTTFVLPLTRADLGDWLGLVLETVSRALGTLQKRGLIAIERFDIVHVLDPNELEILTGDRLVHRLPD